MIIKLQEKRIKTLVKKKLACGAGSSVTLPRQNIFWDLYFFQCNVKLYRFNSLKIYNQ